MFGIFDVETPEGTQPEDVLKDSGDELPIGDSQRITITVTDEPKSFVVMDIMYDSDAPTRVLMVQSDGTVVDASNTPVSINHSYGMES